MVVQPVCINPHNLCRRVLLPGIFEATSIGDLIAIAPEASIHTGINRDGIGRFQLNGESEIESIGSTVLSEHVKGAKPW